MIYSNIERKNSQPNNSVPSKALHQKWRRDKDYPTKKSRGSLSPLEFLIRNTKGNSLNGNKRTLISQKHKKVA